MHCTTMHQQKYSHESRKAQQSQATHYRLQGLTHLLNSTQVTSAPKESFLPGMIGALRLVTSQTVTSESEEPQATKFAWK